MLTNKKSLDSEFSSDHLEMEKLVKEINNSWHAIGAVKNDISKSEKIYRKYRRSIYSIKNIKKGNKLSEENIRIIRPGLGMEPRFISKVLNKKAINEIKWLSNFDNSCFNIKVFAEAFHKSKVFFQSNPLSVNLSGSRHWKNIYYFLEIIRFPEMLDYYRTKGMSFFRYIYCKNFALRNFSNYMVKIYLKRKKESGWEYINFYRHIFVNLIYPNIYLSLVYFLLSHYIHFVLKIVH